MNQTIQSIQSIQSIQTLLTLLTLLTLPAIQGLNQTGATGVVDLFLLLATIGGYLFVAFKQYTMPKLKPAPQVDRSKMSWAMRIFSFGRRSTHELSAEEWQSIRQARKVGLPIILGFAVLLGYLASAYGLVAAMWIWLAAAGGAGVRVFSDRRA